jgi:hypothetical protein
MSAALSRLRRIFNLLLVTGHETVKPTERALAIDQEFAPLLNSWRFASAPRDILDESAPARAVCSRCSPSTVHIAPCNFLIPKPTKEDV